MGDLRRQAEKYGARDFKAWADELILRIPENIIGSPRLGDEIIAPCVLIVAMGATAVGVPGEADLMPAKRGSRRRGRISRNRPPPAV